MLHVVPALLEVSAKSVFSACADQPHQEKCEHCATTGDCCGVREIQDPLRDGLLVKCPRCIGRRRACSWGQNIPVHLYHLKCAILCGESVEAVTAGSTGPEATEADAEVRPPDAVGEPKVRFNYTPEALSLLSAVTFAALAEVEARIQEEMENETVKLCTGIMKVYGLGSGFDSLW